MEKGLAIIEINDTETRAIHFDQEVLEFARLNTHVKKRVAVAEAQKRNAERTHRRAEKAVARRREYTIRTFCFVLSRIAAAVAVTWAAWTGLVHPIISIPFATICASLAFLRLGMWFGKVGK